METYALVTLDTEPDLDAEVRILRSRFGTWIIQGVFLDKTSPALPTFLNWSNEDLGVAGYLFKAQADEAKYHLIHRFLPGMLDEAYRLAKEKLSTK